MIKVLIVEDSEIDKKVLTHILNNQDDIEVVGTADDPYEARQKIAELNPDVLTLDVLMPRMDGLSFLGKLMEHFPSPVVMVSSITPQDSDAALLALNRGAVDVIRKPDADYSPAAMAKDLLEAVRAASKVNFGRKIDKTGSRRQKKGYKSRSSIADEYSMIEKQVMALGASTGGTRALEHVLTNLPPNIPGTVIVQHMPEFFTKSFADRLNTICRVTVREAVGEEPVRPGEVLIAPGKFQMTVERRGKGFVTRIWDGPPVNFHKPSVDVLFESVAKAAGKNAMGIILTGMGKDGAKGLLAMKREGAYTIGQDEASSVVYGMPKEANRIGATTEVLPLNKIARAITRQLNRETVSVGN